MILLDDRVTREVEVDRVALPLVDDGEAALVCSESEFSRLARFRAEGEAAGDTDTDTDTGVGVGVDVAGVSVSVGWGSISISPVGVSTC